MNRTFLGLAGAAIGTVMMAGHAGATIIPAGLTIDFRDAAWSGANGNTSFSVPPVTAEALPQDFFTPRYLFQDSVDGLGVKSCTFFGILCEGSDTGDEVNHPESLKITITGGQLLSGVWITDLFDPPDGSDPINGEVGRVVINGSSTFDFYGKDSDQGNGEQYVSFGSDIVVNTAEFFTLAYTYDCSTNRKTKTCSSYDDNEFSVAGLVGPAINTPEPASLALFGAALAGLGLARRRRQS